jgi:hypothetical protein
MASKVSFNGASAVITEQFESAFFDAEFAAELTVRRLLFLNYLLTKSLYS